MQTVGCCPVAGLPWIPAEGLPRVLRSGGSSAVTVESTAVASAPMSLVWQGDELVS